MTKKKAIEAAISAGWQAYTSGLSFRTIAENIEILAEVVADRAYENGRIAGLRKFVNLLPHSGMMRARDTRRKFRSYANALAKKARATK